MSGARLTINLGALARNWQKLRDAVAPAECSAVVKADAYGLGIEQAAPALWQAGCRTFFVAHVSEAVRVRAALGAAAPVLVLNGLPLGAEAVMAAHNLVPVIGSLPELARWADFSAITGAKLPVALHFDTGMNRLGFSGAGQAEAVARLASGLRVVLVMSHLVSAEDRENPQNPAQIAAFSAIAAQYPETPASLSNSSGIFLEQRPFFDMVRPGYALYGGNPVPGRPNPMESVVALEADIIQTHWVEPGTGVGYNSRWTAKRQSHLATIGIGYADGFPFHAGRTDNVSRGAQVVVLGKSCPVVGRVSMDLIVLDITGLGSKDLPPGTSAQLLGDVISVDDLASASDTIGYAVLTGLGKRYARAYRQ